MNENKISTRYAKALFSFAKEKNIFDKINSDIELFVFAYYDIKEFNLLINSPTAKKSEKKKIIENIFENKVSNEFLNFLKLVIDNKREKYIDYIFNIFKKMYLAHVGIKTVTITSAKEINAELTDKISSLISSRYNTKVELDKKINASLIGGFILKVDDEQYDASISTRLKRIKTQLKATNIN